MYLKGAMSSTKDSAFNGEVPPKTFSQASGSGVWCSSWCECCGPCTCGQLRASRYALPKSLSDVLIWREIVLLSGEVTKKKWPID